MSKAVFYKVGRFEILLNNVDAVSEIGRGARAGLKSYDILVKGLNLNRTEPEGTEELKKERDALISQWKECVK